MTNNKEQSSVEELYNEMYKIIEFYAGDEQLAKCMVLRKLAKEMHKVEIVNAVDGFPLPNRGLEGEDYYEETYGSNK